MLGVVYTKNENAMTLNKENEIRTYGQMRDRLAPIAEAIDEILGDVENTAHWDKLIVEKIYRMKLDVKYAIDLTYCFNLEEDQPDFFQSDTFKEWVKQRRLQQYEDELAYEAESDRDKEERNESPYGRFNDGTPKGFFD